MSLTDPTANARRRQAIRVPYDKDLLLEFDNGLVLAGRAQDISSTGFFLGTASPGFDRTLGWKGQLVIDLVVERIRIPCQVARVIGQGVGVHYLE
ncbi:MAG: PilZ domain-containing protein [Magnetococcales bacterium]|nr:PilZ domain-containing protein [Magnetococcales bacterium]